MELFEIVAGTSIQHVPFRGSGPVLTELVAERVQAGMDNIPSALPFIRDGRIRALAVTSLRRSPVLPEVPTLDEAGLQGFEATAWFGVLAPGRTPAPVIRRLGAELDAVVRGPSFQARLAEFGATPPDLTPDGGTSPETFAAVIRAEIAKWAEVVRRSGARVD
jgi:tripartite-type tricarboxylate transporter receptor subunit TctC